MLHFLSAQIYSAVLQLAHRSPSWFRGAFAPTPVVLTLLLGWGNAAVPQTVNPSAAGTPWPDGIYFYGEVPQRDQMGKAYLIFAARGQKLVGAFYLPRSSFDCFYGQVTHNQLTLTVIDSYDRTPHPYAVALEPVAIASNANLSSPSLQFQPQGFHPLQEVTDLEQKILKTCHQDMI